ncbi:SAG1386/EF1546 family surface-associated protein [Streptococcus pneumoniae]
MEKEGWEENIYENGEEELKRSNKSTSVLATRLLTILATIFCIIVIIMVAVLVYLSTGGSNKQTNMNGFFSTTANAGATTETVASSSEPVEGEEQPEEETPQTQTEGTIVVQAGEGEASIAARAGISIADLERLNPSHMSTGAWYANPGDVVKIQ